MRAVYSRFRLSTLFDFASLSFFIQFSRFLVVRSRFRFGKLPENSPNPPACRSRFRFRKLFWLSLNSLWWAQVDSNHRPHAYQACALTT